MKLYDNWKDLIRRAWSIRLMVVAGILSAVEVVLPLFADDIPRGLFAALSGVTVAAAFVARLVAQQDLE
jgi:hypothetical protein